MNKFDEISQYEINLLEKIRLLSEINKDLIENNEIKDKIIKKQDDVILAQEDVIKCYNEVLKEFKII